MYCLNRATSSHDIPNLPAGDLVVRNSKLSACLPNGPPYNDYGAVTPGIGVHAAAGTGQEGCVAPADEDLIRAIQNGCDKSFEILFARYWKLVFVVASKLLRRSSDAEDIVQDVFLTIYLHSDKYDASRGSARTWIAQFAYFKALVRRRSLQISELDDFDAMRQFEAGLLRLGRTEGVLERAVLVQECLAALNPHQRRTLELVHFEGYTLLETANILEESLANTRNLYYRGIRALRAQLLPTPPESKNQGPGVVEALPNVAAESFFLGRTCRP